MGFESALTVYKENGVLEEDEPEIQEFNDIMEFLYLGRKEKVKKYAMNFYFLLLTYSPGFR